MTSPASLFAACNSFAAWEARACLHFLTDEDLQDVIASARAKLLRLKREGREGEFVSILIDALNADPGELKGEPIDEVARALQYLAHHGFPHGPPTAH